MAFGYTAFRSHPTDGMEQEWSALQAHQEDSSASKRMQWQHCHGCYVAWATLTKQ